MFQDKLKELRTSKGLLQKDVAIFLGITTSAYGFYEQGKRDPDTATLIKIAQYFNVSIDYLLGCDDKPNKIGKSLSPERERLLKQISTLSDEEVIEMEQIADYVKSKKEKNDQAATTA